MIKKIFLLVIIIVSFFWTKAQGVELLSNVEITASNLELKKDSSKNKNSYLALPFAAYLPETRWLFGGTVLCNFYYNKKDSLSNASQIIISAAYTQNNQLLLYMPYQLYFNENKWRASGEIGYYKYSYNYYGKGNENLKDFKENYAVNYPRFRLHLLKKMKHNIFFGLQYWFENFDIKQESFDQAGQLIQGNTIGSIGGKTAGIGLISQYDTRDNVYSPTQGFFVQGTVHTNSKYTFSEYDFDRYRLDFRYYYPLGKTQTIASQVFIDNIKGNPPFSQLAFFGGSKKVRGYEQERFRDNSMVMGQLEYRINIWKRIGAVAFYDYAMVSNKIKTLSTKYAHDSFGIGLRFMTDVDKKVNIRLDYAFTPLGNNFYFTFGEAF